ncbi:hypothetical protein DUI87_16292 [Hirundo rustica rustica]|uniref:Uncharacterized protein n=1 Tax=Hirundo rustica rustica TaxID=333673 RepID=A0A3M0K104_HIRRU|nr:hypothetical protein DUI87_16292 [Hirundo rustica rustica]
MISKQSWESEEVPIYWKLANVVPVFKNDKKDDIGNYRPVSLTSVAETNATDSRSLQLKFRVSAKIKVDPDNVALYKPQPNRSPNKEVVVSGSHSDTVEEDRLGFRLAIRKKFLTVRHWKKFPREVVDAQFLEVFKVILDGNQISLVWWKVSLPMAGKQELDGLQGNASSSTDLSDKAVFKSICWHQDVVPFPLLYYEEAERQLIIFYDQSVMRDIAFISHDLYLKF